MTESKSSYLSECFPDVPPADVDLIDIELLRALAEDGRASLKSLAERVGLSSPAVSDRIARLAGRGVIRGYKVDINWAAVGYSTVAFLSISAPNSLHEDIVRILRATIGVEELWITSGSTDIVAKVRAAGFDALRRLLAEQLWTIDGVQNVETSIAFFSSQVPETVRGMLDDLERRQGG